MHGYEFHRNPLHNIHVYDFLCKINSEPAKRFVRGLWNIKGLRMIANFFGLMSEEEQSDGYSEIKELKDLIQDQTPLLTAPEIEYLTEEVIEVLMSQKKISKENLREFLELPEVQEQYQIPEDIEFREFVGLVKKAAKTASQRDYILIFGHTHNSFVKKDPETRTILANSGSWQEDPVSNSRKSSTSLPRMNTFLRIDQQQIRLGSFQNGQITYYPKHVIHF